MGRLTEKLSLLPGLQLAQRRAALPAKLLRQPLARLLAQPQVSSLKRNGFKTHGQEWIYLAPVSFYRFAESPYSYFLEAGRVPEVVSIPNRGF
jgi:hypothetical protein